MAQEVQNSAVPDLNGARAWYLLVLLSLAFVLSMMDRTILSLLVEPIKQEFGLSDTAVAVLQGASFAIFYALAGVPLGWLADRGNRRDLVAGGIGLWSGMTMLSGIASSYALLFVGRTGVAVGEAVLAPAAYSMLADRFSKDRLGRAIGVFTAAGVLGTGLALVAGGAIYQSFVASGGIAGFSPWQATLLTVGAPGLLLAGLFLLSVGEPVRTRPAQTARSPGSVLNVVRARVGEYVPLLLGYAAVSMLGYTFLSWAPTSLIRVHGMTTAEAGSRIGAIVTVCGLLGPVGGGWLVDFAVRRDVPDAPIRGLVAAAALALASVWLTALASGRGATLVGYGGVALSFTAMLAIVPLTIQLIAPADMRARLSAISLVVANTLGLGVGPLIVGLLNDRVFIGRGGIATSLPIVLGAAALLAFALFATAWRGARVVARPEGGTR